MHLSGNAENHDAFILGGKFFRQHIGSADDAEGNLRVAFDIFNFMAVKGAMEIDARGFYRCNSTGHRRAGRLCRQ